MKNKRLIVLLSVLAFITVLVVINSTLFTLQNISINWLTTKSELQKFKDYDLVGDIHKGQSIFLLDKSEMSANLEKEFPYLNVVSIETKFPNKIVVHSAERESLYAVCLSSDTYAILDEKGKVLDKISGKELNANSEGGLRPRPIVTNFSGTLNPEDFEVGEFVKRPDIGSMINSLSTSLREAGYNPTTSKGVLSAIDINSSSTEYDSSLVVMKTRSGISLSVLRFEELLTDKIMHAFYQYNQLHNQGAVDCEIIVWYNSGPNLIESDIKWNLS
ncbi:MAG: FtsQ-type POTRA domain-containing protein [Clostridia bacterium]|nr:FtsQ-type POTRA domain-containing protein [Clostridia bacterium]